MLYKLFNSRNLLFVIISLLIIALIMYEYGYKHNTYDLAIYYSGGKILREGYIKDLYNLELQKGYLSDSLLFFSAEEHPNIEFYFRNLPLNTLLYFPFTFLPAGIVSPAHVTVNILLVAISIIIILKSLKVDKKNKYIFFLIAWLFPFIIYAIGNHHFIIATFIISLCYFYSVKGSSFKTGFFSSFLMLHLQYIIFIPFLFILVKDKIRFLYGFILSWLSLFLLNLWIYGPNLAKDYLLFLINTESVDKEINRASMVTLFSLITRFNFISDNIAYLINFVLYILVLVAIYYLVRRKTKNFDTLFFASIIFSIIFSIHGFRNELVLLILPLLYEINSNNSFLKINRIIIIFLITVVVYYSINISILMYFLTILGISYFVEGMKSADQNLQNT